MVLRNTNIISGADPEFVSEDINEALIQVLPSGGDPAGLVTGWRTILRLSTQVGEESPVRGFHAATVAGTLRLASSKLGRLTGDPGLPVS